MFIVGYHEAVLIGVKELPWSNAVKDTEAPQHKVTDPLSHKKYTAGRQYFNLLHQIGQAVDDLRSVGFNG
jgi:hypothetical protein